MTNNQAQIDFIGDIHANFDIYMDYVLNSKTPSIQVGDFGLGMPNNDWRFRNGITKYTESDLFDFWSRNPQHKIIRGNHDKPLNFRGCPAYLGDYGYDPTQKLFWLSGAISIDAAVRREGYSWWRDEELSIGQLNEAVTLFRETSPEFMVSHECPSVCVQPIIASDRGVNPEKVATIASRTGQALSAMWSFHKPKVWVFGHYHHNWQMEFEGTLFVCVGTNSKITLDLTSGSLSGLIDKTRKARYAD